MRHCFCLRPREQEGHPAARVLYQRGRTEASRRSSIAIYPFRCIGMRTDMKAKVFEWIDAGFDVPLSLIQDVGGSESAPGHRLCHRLRRHHRQYLPRGFWRRRQQNERHATCVAACWTPIWAALAAPFRDFVMSTWPTLRCERHARTSVVDRASSSKPGMPSETYSEMAGSDAAALRQRVTGRRTCDIRLSKDEKSDGE